ncbi:hypothetical protein ElyMa_000880900 [Elysia marginata]|uniref:Uncharacterized protein n=1 Tax=Elysia marginata TaxID=1093978 RepID=A0AAV4H4Y3_9GAST|nr:hypothetical protein ElyMa_000880900 [Elysia marginata]
MVVRLDIWHFMRRLASCVSSESHPLYAVFLRKLSAAIFQWDDGDITKLQEAKAKEIQSQGLGLPVELTSKEPNTHCRRRTRGESAGAVNFQAYLLEGLVRWNEDRHAAAVGKRIMLRDYKMQCDAVTAATKLGVEPVVKPFHPAPYTGELIGAEYLFSQTGEPLSHPDEEEAVPEEEEELEVEAEEAVNFTIPPPPGASPAASSVASPESASTIICSSLPHLMEEAPETERQEEPPRPQMVLDGPTSGADMVRPFSLLLPKVQVYTRLIFMSLFTILKSEVFAFLSQQDTVFRHSAGQGGLGRLMALARHLVEFRKVDALSN